jgi:hypothetical protein
MPQLSPDGASQRHSTRVSGVEQLGIPTDVTPGEIARKQSLGGAIELCAEAAGYALDKQLASDLGVDKAQFSRWTTGTEGIVWPKLRALMDKCGNDAPVLWMLHARGYDLSSLRKRETETERALRIAEERIKKLEEERAVERRMLSEVLAGRVGA